MVMGYPPGRDTKGKSGLPYTDCAGMATMSQGQKLPREVGMQDIEQIARTPAGLVMLVVAGASTLAAVAWVVSGWMRHGRVLPRVGLPVVPWGLGSVALAGLVWLLLQMVVVLTYMQVAHRPADEDAAKIGDVLSPREIVALGLVSNVLTIVVVPPVLARHCGARRDDFGLGPDQPIALNLLRGYLACSLVAPVVYGVFWLSLKAFPLRTHSMEEMFRGDRPISTAILGLLAAVVAAPIAEELLFRGVLMGWLARLFAGRGLEARTWEEGPSNKRLPDDWQPVVATALLWAAIHAEQWPAPIPLLLLGVALGWIYQRTGTLWASIGLHAGFNGISTIWVIARTMVVGDAGAP
jgi:membrane protease YdiL (CAAX protease family)